MTTSGFCQTQHVSCHPLFGRHRRAFALLIGALALAACSSSPTTANPDTASPSSSTAATTEANIPSSCDATDVLAALQKVLDNAELVDTPWEPAPGTDLAAVIDGGGLACAYGHPRAELGATVLWLDNATAAIDSRRATWASEGTPLDVEGADAAWFIDPSESESAEMPSWVVNAIVGDIWIQVRSNIGQTAEQGRDFTLAAVLSLRS